MDSLNQIEIQNIRHICGKCSNNKTKAEYYKTLTQDQEVIQVLDSLCTELDSLKSELSSMV